jgi:hypothetical protein
MLKVFIATRTYIASLKTFKGLDRTLFRRTLRDLVRGAGGGDNTCALLNLDVKEGEEEKNIGSLPKPEHI